MSEENTAVEGQENQEQQSAPSFQMYKDGAPTEGFLNSIPEDYSGVKGIASKYQNEASFYEGITNLNKMAMGKGLAPLDAMATDEDKQKFFDHMRYVNGAPMEASEYEMNKPEGLDDSMWDGEQLNGYKDIFHKYSANPEMVKEIMSLYGENTMGALEQGKQGQETQMAEFQQGRQKELIDTWGSEYTAMNDKVNNLIKTLGEDPDQMLKYADAKTYAMLGRMTKMVSEASLNQGSEQELTPATRQAKMEELAQHPAMHNSNDPQHREVMKQWANITSFSG